MMRPIHSRCIACGTEENPTVDIFCDYEIRTCLVRSYCRSCGTITEMGINCEATAGSQVEAKCRNRSVCKRIHDDMAREQAVPHE